MGLPPLRLGDDIDGLDQWLDAAPLDDHPLPLSGWRPQTGAPASSGLLSWDSLPEPEPYGLRRGPEGRQGRTDRSASRHYEPAASPELESAHGTGAMPSAAARAVREKARRQRLNDMCAAMLSPCCR